MKSLASPSTSTSPNNLRLRIERGEKGKGRARNGADTFNGLSLIEEPEDEDDEEDHQGPSVFSAPPLPGKRNTS